MKVDSVYAKLASREASIGVVGLGYVGLPLACLLAQKFKVVGFDINQKRVKELSEGVDHTLEVTEKERLTNKNLTYTTNAAALGECPLIIVAVPTPVDDYKKPDLKPLLGASKTVGSVMKKGTVVVFESTVYPGLTEDVCGQALSAASGYVLGTDYSLGYSPERVNPGDKQHTIDKIVKVVAGLTPDVTELLAQVYGAVITAGVHRAPSIATAEAAKVIENTQRDINIALINELSMLFDRIGLDTQDVLEAARTKWNFLDFRPGLVGGHCIGVDPYYLTHLAERVGLHPQVIAAGRRINDNVSQFIAQKTVALSLNNAARPIDKLRVAILGVTFKENVPDLRNSKVPEIAAALRSFGVEVYLCDPIADAAEFEHEYHMSLTNWRDIPQCDAAIVAVKHDIFTKEFPLARLVEKLSESKVVIDVKGMFSRKEAKDLGVTIWRL